MKKLTLVLALFLLSPSLPAASQGYDGVLAPDSSSGGAASEGMDFTSMVSGGENGGADGDMWGYLSGEGGGGQALDEKREKIKKGVSSARKVRDDLVLKQKEKQQELMVSKRQQYEQAMEKLKAQRKKPGTQAE